MVLINLMEMEKRLSLSLSPCASCQTCRTVDTGGARREAAVGRAEAASEVLPSVTLFLCQHSHTPPSTQCSWSCVHDALDALQNNAGLPFTMNVVNNVVNSDCMIGKAAAAE